MLYRQRILRLLLSAALACIAQSSVAGDGARAVLARSPPETCVGVCELEDRSAVFDVIPDIIYDMRIRSEQRTWG